MYQVAPLLRQNGLERKMNLSFQNGNELPQLTRDPVSYIYTSQRGVRAQVTYALSRALRPRIGAGWPT